MPIDLMPHLISAAIRSCGLALIVAGGLWLFRVRSSSTRHATWAVVLVGMLLQIPLGILPPKIPLKAPHALSATLQPRVIESPRIHLPPPSHTRAEPNGIWVSWREILTGVYLVISMLLFVRIVLGSWALRRILRDAKPIPALGPRIFESALFAVPGTVGFFRPRILLPRAWKDWDAVTVRAVLAHERAHIHRRDWFTGIAARVNVCIFWFHPLAWWIERELARLAEEACDDLALFEVEDREEYAATLVDMAHATAAHGGIVNWRAIWMAKDSDVMRRVNRILNERLQVPKPFRRRAWMTLLACSLPVIYLSAAVKLAPALMAQSVPNQPLVPVTMCILIDNSGSMWDKRAEAKAAALALVRASKLNDEVCIVNFSDEVFNALPSRKLFTSDRREMEDALTHIDARGGKAMRDAIRLSIDQIEESTHKNRRVLVLVTEGNDSSSTVTQEELRSKVNNSGARIYCIGLLNEDDPHRSEAARHALGQLAKASGGLDYYPKGLADVENIALQIANELRKQ